MFRQSFDRFGDDLAELLLRYLPLEDRLLLESVNNQWRRVLCRGLVDLVIDFLIDDNNIYANDKPFAELIAKCPNLTSVYFRHPFVVTDKMIGALVANSRHLRHFSMTFGDHNRLDVSDEMFDRFFRLIGPQLWTLSLTGVDCVDIEPVITRNVKWCTNLRKLDIGFRYKHKSMFYLLIGGNNKEDILMTRLKSVSIRVINDSRLDLDTFAAKYGHQLISLVVNVDRDCDDKRVLDSLATCLCQMHRLMDFGIKISPQYIDNGYLRDLLTRMSTNCRDLRRLSIDYRVYLVNTIDVDVLKQLLATIGHNYRQLRRLSVVCQIPKFSSFLLTSDLFGLLKQLKHLSICNGREMGCGSVRVSDEFFNQIDRHLPRLSYLFVTAGNLTVQALNSLANLTHIQHVWVTFYRVAIDDTDINEFINKCPKLRKIKFCAINKSICC